MVVGGGRKGRGDGREWRRGRVVRDGRGVDKRKGEGWGVG